MKYLILGTLVVCSGIVWYTHVAAMSIVYNFRIAQITKQPIVEKPEGKDHKNHVIVALLFDQYQKKYCTNTHQNFGGGLGAFIYDFKSYYFRTDVAVAHIKERSNCITTFSGTETDDILFTLGRNFTIDENASITWSGLFGVPTHKIYRLQHVEFGYSQVGIGVQLDGLYALNSKGTFLYGARYIYFVPKKALDSTGQNYMFTIGNIGDLLFAYKNKWGHHGLEFGYTAKSRFGADVYPSFDEIIEKTNYIRSNLYIVYKYKFLIHDIHNRFLFNIGYGFDHKPKIYGNKYIVTLWTSWNISF